MFQSMFRENLWSIRADNSSRPFSTHPSAPLEPRRDFQAPTEARDARDAREAKGAKRTREARGAKVAWGPRAGQDGGGGGAEEGGARRNFCYLRGSWGSPGPGGRGAALSSIAAPSRCPCQRLGGRGGAGGDLCWQLRH